MDESEALLCCFVSFCPAEPDRAAMLITEDPEDNRVLEVGTEAKADAIGSGDRHLLELKVFEGIPVMSPRQFLDRLG